MNWLNKLLERLWYWYEAWWTERELKRIQRFNKMKEKERKGCGK